MFRAFLTIAGTDPSSGAGISVDMRVAESLGYYPLSVVTAVLAQNLRGVQEAYPMTPESVEAQLESVLVDFMDYIHGIKIGLLPTSGVVEAVARCLKRFHEKTKQRIPVILDPVLASGINGKPLTTAETPASILEMLLPYVTVMTPNLEEMYQCMAISVPGSDAFLEKNSSYLPSDFHYLGCAFAAYYKVFVLTTNAGPKTASSIEHWIYSPDKRHKKVVAGKLLPINVHGTGCQFSTALTLALSKRCQGLGSSIFSPSGLNILVDVVMEASQFMATVLEDRIEISDGRFVCDFNDEI